MDVIHIKSRCTTGYYRRVSRYEHEPVLEAIQDRLDREPERMRARRQTAEHPFATIKSWMGSSHFLTRTLKKHPYGNEFACTGLQHEAGDEYHGAASPDGSNQDIRILFAS